MKSVCKNLDPNAPIGIIIPGYTTEFFPDHGNIYTWATTLNSDLKANIIIVDWIKLSIKSYGCIATYIAPKIADYVAYVIEILAKKYQFHHIKWIFGHSAGAHIAGLASERLPKKLHVCFGKHFLIDFFHL